MTEIASCAPRQQEAGRDELRHEPEREPTGHAEDMDAPARWVIALGPAEKVVDPARVGEDKGRFHDVATQAVTEHERRMYKKEKHGRDTAHRVDQTSSDQEHVDERDGGEDPVPETQSEFIMREQARKSP